MPKNAAKKKHRYGVEGSKKRRGNYVGRRARRKKKVSREKWPSSRPEETME